MILITRGQRAALDLRLSFMRNARTYIRACVAYTALLPAPPKLPVHARGPVLFSLFDPELSRERERAKSRCRVEGRVGAGKSGEFEEGRASE